MPEAPRTVKATPKPIRRYVCSELTKPLPIYSHATIYNGIAHISAVQGFVPGTFSFPEGGGRGAGRADDEEPRHPAQGNRE